MTSREKDILGRLNAVTEQIQRTDYGKESGMCDDDFDEEECGICGAPGDISMDLSLHTRRRGAANEISVSGTVCLSCLGKLRIMLLPLMIGWKKEGE